MFSVFVVEKENLSTKELRDILGLCSRAYEMDYAAIYSTLSDPTHVLAYQDGLLVSHALWVTRWLKPGELPILRTAYVEAVATDPAYQRLGLATTVMQTLQGKILEYELGALSPAKHSFYMKLGWEQWRGTLFIRTERGLLATPGEEVMILHLPLTPRLDLHGSLSAEWREGELW